MTRRYILLGVIGQSNERGRVIAGDDDGVAANGRPQHSTYGPPLKDPVQPGGINGADAVAFGSMWPYLSSRLAKEKDIWLNVINRAVGGTSIVTHWCGAPLPADLNDTPTDPNSYLSDLNTSMTGWDDDYEKWVYISLGQQDSAEDTAQNDFRDGLICATNYCLNKGWKVILGFTTVKPVDTWYVDKGNPGYLAALAHFSGNSNVIAGANLYEALGHNAILYDGDHWAKVTAEQCADEVVNKLSEAGW